MLKNKLSSFLSFDDNKEKYLVLFTLLGYILFSLIWGILEDGTWDDDCPTRYYNTLNAFNEPHHFINVWNRPLFVIIFAIPIHFGKYSILFLMIIFMVISALYLYKGIKSLKLSNAYLIIPFLLFQTYFFNISRNNETEQLAVMLTCMGFYFFTQKKWLYFAIVGSLIPLARLELSVLLIFWAYILLKEKQFKYILLLGIPMVFWNIAGGIIEGDFLYIFNQSVGKENASNRYGHTTFWHYFKRYIYVLGPFIYFFFSIGILNRIKKFKLDSFILMQFVAGFFLYVLFSWKLNMGNAAGFLRNLIPLTPLVAILALEGYNNWINMFSIRKKTNTLVQQDLKFNYLSEDEFYKLNRKKRNNYLKEKKSFEEKNQLQKSILSKSTTSSKRKYRFHLFSNISFALFLLIMAYFFSSKELLSHHKIGKAAFYGNIIGLLIVFAWTLLPLISIRFSEKFKSYSHGLYGIGIGIAALAFTLVTEPINSNMSPERNTMQKVSNLYTNSYLEKLPTYVNHIWFFWANNLNKYDKKYQLVTKENLDSAEVGSICIWENHYSHRLSGDVQATYFTKHPEWIELDHHVSSKKNFRCFIYQKSNKNADSIMSLHDKYLSYQPFSAAGFSARGNTLSTKKNMKQESIKDYTKAIELDSNELSAYFNRGLAYFSLKKYDTAITNFRICFSKNNKWHQSMYNIAACELNLGNFQKSIIAYDSVLTIKSDYHEAILGRAKVHMRMRNNEKALSDLNLFIKLKPKHYDAIINRANIHLSKQNWLPALKDLTTCLKIKSGQSQLWYLKGICELNLQKKEESCKSLNKAHELGNKNALQYLSKVCQ